MCVLFLLTHTHSHKILLLLSRRRSVSQLCLLKYAVFVVVCVCVFARLLVLFVCELVSVVWWCCLCAHDLVCQCVMFASVCGVSLSVSFNHSFASVLRYTSTYHLSTL